MVNRKLSICICKAFLVVLFIDKMHAQSFNIREPVVEFDPDEVMLETDRFWDFVRSHYHYVYLHYDDPDFPSPLPFLSKLSQQLFHFLRHLGIICLHTGAIS